MSLDSTPLAERINICLFGLRNAGKSSLFNNILGKNVAIVSDEAGTTTDPVTKMMEMGKLGPVSITDTAGFDDEGSLGSLRIDKTMQALEVCHIAVLVTRADTEPTPDENHLIEECSGKHKPVIIVLTHCDLNPNKAKTEWASKSDCVKINNINGDGILELKNLLESYHTKVTTEITPLQGIVKPNSLLYLITPVDTAAPKGRLILPQVETLRDALDRECASLVVQADKLGDFYKRTDKPDLIITDSQAFQQVAEIIPASQNLTSFSILFARKKGDLSYFIRSLGRLKNIKPNAKILIMESCTHHKQEDDIGTVKIPRIFKAKIEPTAQFDFSHGPDFDIPRLKEYHLVITCGACMISRNTMLARLNVLKENDIAVTNYGLFLAYANNLLPRAIECLPEAYKEYIELFGN